MGKPAFEQHNYMSRQFLKTLSCSMKLMAMFFRKTAAISGWTIFSTMTAFSSSRSRRWSCHAVKRPRLAVYMTLQRMTISKDLG
ncbi:hypothetical protein J4714_12595, partial [Staphylococcus epidermidis]|nr:hypothetical protein [Staphylococcus epidermidis]